MNQRRETVLINGRALSYSVRKSKRARKLKVEVSRRQGVVIVLPWCVSYDEVPSLLNEYGPWLASKADELDVRCGPRVRQYGTGSKVLVFGRPVSISAGPLPAGRTRPRLELVDDVLAMSLPPDQLLNLRLPLEKFLRRLARTDLPERVEHWAAIIGSAPDKVIIGERTSRWGSCSSRGTISLCYRLVMAPPEVIEATVAHEICHLVHLNHSERFYALLDSVCPGHRQTMAWLGVHEDELIL